MGGGEVRTALRDLAAELVRLKPDVIVAVATPAVQAAKQASKAIPIVMVSVGNPVAAGFVASVARPGGNITGLANIASELVGKQLQLLREVVPTSSLVAVLWNPANQSNASQLREAEAAARALGVRVQPLEAQDPSDLDRAFLAMTRERAGALLVLSDSMFIVQRERIADRAAKSRRAGLPAPGPARDAVESTRRQRSVPDRVMGLVSKGGRRWDAQDGGVIVDRHARRRPYENARAAPRSTLGSSPHGS